MCRSQLRLIERMGLLMWYSVAGTPPPTPMEGDDGSVNEIPSFSVTAPGGRAKEQTLGIRR